jgi:hypothetical protein
VITGMDLGQPVMMERRGRFPRVVHRLERVKSAKLLYPYVMACGYAATAAVLGAADDAERCRRCWPEGAA